MRVNRQLVLALLVLVSLSACTAPSAPFHSQALAAINAIRAQGANCAGTTFPPAPPVSWSQRLAQAALSHSAYMAASGIFSHIGPNGLTPVERMNQAGYYGSLYGENLAVGSSLTAEGAIAVWMQDEGHWANLMNPGFSQIGLEGASGNFQGVPAVYWTLDLAHP